MTEIYSAYVYRSRTHAGAPTTTCASRSKVGGRENGDASGKRCGRIPRRRARRKLRRQETPDSDAAPRVSAILAPSPRPRPRPLPVRRGSSQRSLCDRLSIVDPNDRTKRNHYRFIVREGRRRAPAPRETKGTSATCIPVNLHVKNSETSNGDSSEPSETVRLSEKTNGQRPPVRARFGLEKDRTEKSRKKTVIMK